jgi:hypothetical protein
MGRLPADKIKLLASLAFNFVSKVPGMVAVFIILPLASEALGTVQYGAMLSALALGSAFTLPSGGINAVGRRLLASAVGLGDRPRQADVFVTTTALMGLVLGGCTLVMVLSTARTWPSAALIWVSLLPVAASLFNVFDNLRASFNEHYVTAIFQLLFQVTIYLAVYLLGLPGGNPVVAGLVLQAPFIIASLASVLLLLQQRPYLYQGRISGLRGMVAPAAGVTLADGALASALNLSVFWLSVQGASDMSAWVGTFSRLFQSFMSPVLLILFPVTTFVSMRWAKMPVERRLMLHRLFLALGFVYGAIVAVAMGFGGQLYINHMFHLAARGDRFDVIALSVFMGAVIAQKAYTMMLYAVTEARFVSYGTALVCAAGALGALLASKWLPAMRAIDFFFIGVGTALPLLLVVGSFRYRRAASVSEVG